MTWVSTAIKQRFSTPPVQGVSPQILLAGVAGLVLGLFIIEDLSLQSRQLTFLFLLAVFFLFVAMIVGNVQKLLLAVIIMAIPFHVDINLGYREDVARLDAVPGLDVSVTTIALIILYILWLGEFLSKQESAPRPLLHESRPLIFYLAFVFLSVIAASDIILSVFQIFLLLHMFLIFLYVASTVRNQQDVLFIVKILLVGFILQSVLILVIGLTGREFEFPGISTNIRPAYAERTWSSSRVGGTLGPNGAGGYLSMLSTLAVSVLLTRLGRWYKLLAMLAGVLGGAALLVTGSRGGWLAFVVAISVFVVSAWRRGWLSLRVPCSIVIIGVLTAILFQDRIISRLGQGGENAAYSRIPLMKLAARMIEDNPVLGVGANNFGVRMNDYVSGELVGEWIRTVHNKYLLVWAESGPGALFAFLWFLVATLRRGWRCWRVGDRFLASLALGITSGICGLMVHMTVDIFHSASINELLALFAALLVVMQRLQRCSVRIS